MTCHVYSLWVQQTAEVLYVGLTDYPEVRFAAHKSCANTGDARPLYFMMRARGLDNVRMRIHSSHKCRNEGLVAEAVLTAEMNDVGMAQGNKARIASYKYNGPKTPEREAVASQVRAEGGLTRWCENRSLDLTAMSHFMSGRRGPSGAALPFVNAAIEQMKEETNAR